MLGKRHRVNASLVNERLSPKNELLSPQACLLAESMLADTFTDDCCQESRQSLRGRKCSGSLARHSFHCYPSTRLDCMSGYVPKPKRAWARTVRLLLTLPTTGAATAKYQTRSFMKQVA